MSWLLLHRRVPTYTTWALSHWWHKGSASERARALSYFANKANGVISLLAARDIIGRAAELSHMYGFDLWSTFSRGSQFRVESMMIRITKAQNLLHYTPSKNEVAQQRAPECIALVMEPESLFYPDPVVVLDFQSLYPSIMIAYNLCYSTCLGILAEGEGRDNSKRFGCARLAIPRGLLGVVSGAEAVTVTPNNIMFLNSATQKGVLAQLLGEILETRIMVKQAMKSPEVKQQPALLRQLDARQLGLKMIANVTYGYTAASFSGRMPCVDLADAIVATARATLEAAIRLVNSSPQWGARVVYGDTDSMFVSCVGASRQRAFEIGKEISAAVTAMNPAPVKLNFEKVYHGSVLVSKKRYAGWKFESADSPPVLEVKGLETIRRDQCPLTSKLLRHTLEVLFARRDLTAIKAALVDNCLKVLADRLPLQDFVFRKEVRLGTYASGRSAPPAALVAARMMEKDQRAEPRYGERVPYVVVAGDTPQTRLADLVQHPAQVLANAPTQRIHHRYYLTKQLLPALHRVLACVGVDVWQWWLLMPRSDRTRKPLAPTGALPLQHIFTPPALAKQMTLHQQQQLGPVQPGHHPTNNRVRIDEYYASQRCLLCDDVIVLSRKTRGTVLCAQCSSSPSSAAVLASRIHASQRRLVELSALCNACANVGADADAFGGLCCASLDCAALYERLKAHLQHYELTRALTNNA